MGSCHSEFRVFILWKTRKSQRKIREKKKENKADAVQGVCFSFCSAAGGVDTPLVESAGERVRPAGGGAAAQPPVRVSASLILMFFFLFFPSNVSIYQCVFKAVFVGVQTTASYKSAQSDL